ncbi:unnamed protein product [Brassica napus]|uniref:(rape) hypothetical protein n=1 Tax=Brassica napus TaxID=3708 RepID=A0A816K4I3_BRANA|nr:unnamed protein product [Brassica napus]
MEVLFVCGQWRLKDAFQWEFHVDLNRNASFISIEEDLQFEDLMKIVSEDFKEEVIGLSYGMSLDIKSTVEGFPPISVANTLHLRSFIGKSRSFDGTCRLCVKVNADSASCNNQASDTFASPVSTVQREIQVHTDPTSCNRQTSDTFASHVPLNVISVFCSTVQREKQLPLSDFFVVKKYVHEHTCDTTHRNANHRQASANLLGSLICSNYGEKKEGLKPKQIIEQVKILHGVHINYKQAWRVKEEAQFLVRGTPEDSYYNLSMWLYKVTETNPGSLTYQQVDAAGKFKYPFVAFDPSIRGFSLMRKVIAVDVVDAENGASWKWFFRGLSQMISDASDLLVFRFGAAMLLNVYQVDQNEFEVKDETMKYVVDLEKRHCTCNVFDIDKILCIHAITAAKYIKRDENRYVDTSHLTETWAKAYAESIHPGGELSTSTYPANIDELSCPPPATKKRSGRPPTKRKRSVGEFGVPGSKSQSHKCSRCGIGGHNKITCKRPIG